jgi:phospholipase/carboxylesterase
MNPPGLASVLAAMLVPEEDLQTARPRAAPWSRLFIELGAKLDAASDSRLETFAGLRASATAPRASQELFRAIRHVPRAMEALYPLASVLPPVNRFFLDAEKRTDADFQQRFLEPRKAGTGVIRFGDDADARTPVWAHVPDTYSPAVACPLVMVLHGGRGRDWSFLWKWVREARS